MNGAVDILAAGMVAQSLGFTTAALVFGLAVRRQLRIAAPPKAPAQDKRKDEAAAEPGAEVTNLTARERTG